MNPLIQHPPAVAHRFTSPLLAYVSLRLRNREEGNGATVDERDSSMRNSLIISDEDEHNLHARSSTHKVGKQPHVRRSRRSFIPLARSSFWGALSAIQIGGVGAGAWILLFLPTLYTIWFEVQHIYHSATSNNERPSLTVTQFVFWASWLKRS